MVIYVMILRVYGVDDVLWIVRFYCGFRVEGIRFGYSVLNSSIIIVVMIINVYMNV